ncbi:hypothetical protein [Mammaliicoccus sp. E-M24]|uniref:hypothetical protein n=1 Tax=Mammaliicoccus sp. E-M24 TaxID=2898684 RepID=UPI001EFBF918|nr:hypothetical protein [Mammaliicoccus sp. E-M24]
MKNIEKLEKVLTKELVGENVEIVRYVEKLEINPKLIKGAHGLTYSNYIYNLKYLIALNEKGYRNMEVELSIDLADLKHSKDSEEEKELLAILIQEHLEKLEDKIKYQIKQLDYQNNYAKEVSEKVQNYFDSKNKFKGGFGFKDGNLYVTGSGAKIMNTPYKHEVLETPDGLKLGEPIIKPIPSEKILLGSLTLQEKGGKLAVTDKNGSTRFI